VAALEYPRADGEWRLASEDCVTDVVAAATDAERDVDGWTSRSASNRWLKRKAAVGDEGPTITVGSVSGRVCLSWLQLVLICSNARVEVSDLYKVCRYDVSTRLLWDWV